MKKTLIVLIVVGALAVGAGGAYAAGQAINNARAETIAASAPVEAEEPLPEDNEEGEALDGPRDRPLPPGQMKKERNWTERKNWMGPGMMAPGGYLEDAQPQGERLSLEDAVTAAQQYAAALGENLRVARVMAFSENFYAVVVEEDTGRGALELLIDPYTGRVRLEPGPTRMWNVKYGHMRLRVDEIPANTLSMQEAAEAAQAYLDENLQGALVEVEGVAFYGYYNFDYTVDGEVAGMLSVNATSGNVWPHTWRGTFIEEKEIDA